MRWSTTALAQQHSPLASDIPFASDTMLPGGKSPKPGEGRRVSGIPWKRSMKLSTDAQAHTGSWDKTRGTEASDTNASLGRRPAWRRRRLTSCASDNEVPRLRSQSMGACNS